MPELLLPGLMMILGAALVPVLPHMLRQVWMLVLIAASAYQCWHIDPGVHLTTSVIGFDLILVRAEAITRPFEENGAMGLGLLLAEVAWGKGQGRPDRTMARSSPDCPSRARL